MAKRITNLSDQSNLPIINQALQDIDQLKQQVTALQNASPAVRIYTPTISAATGSFTSAVARGRYVQIGALVFITVLLRTITVGTASAPLLSLPVMSNGQSYALTGVENQINGLSWTGEVSWGGHKNLFVMRRYDDTNAPASGSTIIMSGFYEAA